MPHFLVIDDTVNRRGIDLLRAAGTVEVIPSSTPENGIIDRLSNVDGILVRKGRITARIVDAAPRLKIVARHGVGVDTVDLDALSRRGVLLTTTGAANSSAVAEYTMAMLLALTRHVPSSSNDLRDGKWTPANYLGVQMEGKVLGIVGYGQIGQLVCRYARAFGASVLVVDPFVEAETLGAAGAEKVAYDDMLPRSDFITFHVRLNDETRGMFGRRHLSIVKPGVRIVNTARGGVCDEDALLEGLESGVIAGVALDTFATEPLPADHPLRRHPHALLTPHIAGQTDVATVNMAVTAAQSLIDCVEGRVPKYIYRAAGA